MHLKSITLENFRCFKHIEIPLHPRLTVLVAENGGGKTSILDGIAIGLSPLLRYLSSANQRLSGPGIEDTDFYEWVDDARCIVSDYALVSVETTEGLKWDNWRASSKGKGLQPDRKIGQTELAAFASTLLDSLKTTAPAIFPVFAYYGVHRGWIVISERLRGESNVNYAYPASALVGALKSLCDFKEMLKWFDTEEASELRENKGVRFKEYVESFALSIVRNAITTILGGAYKDPQFNKEHKFTVMCEDGVEARHVSQLSQGYQSMLALGMDFARRLALANSHLIFTPELLGSAFVKENVSVPHPGFLNGPLGPSLAPAIMLIDEVDLHLHPSWQQRVLDDLMRAFPNTQFIVTTHSPQVLSTVRKENIRIIEKTEEGSWQAREPSRNPYAHASSLSLEAIMGIDSYPPLPIREKLREYQRLVGDAQHDSPRAKELRADIEKEWGVGDPELQLMDVTIRKNETLQKMRQKTN